MIFRFFLLFIGFGLAVIGGISVLAYLNLLTVGYTLSEYFQFLLRRLELYIFILGIILVWTMIYLPLKRR
ncbi:MAG: hypothetical protein LRY73_10280 [Bacillus sp. (in: Bacteria)]|nr:hypothetical protein [Bacillus sp. (in: firmicutes)]